MSDAVVAAVLTGAVAGIISLLAAIWVATSSRSAAADDRQAAERRWTADREQQERHWAADREAQEQRWIRERDRAVLRDRYAAFLRLTATCITDAVEIDSALRNDPPDLVPTNADRQKRNEMFNRVAETMHVGHEIQLLSPTVGAVASGAVDLLTRLHQQLPNTVPEYSEGRRHAFQAIKSTLLAQRNGLLLAARRDLGTQAAEPSDVPADVKREEDA